MAAGGDAWQASKAGGRGRARWCRPEHPGGAERAGVKGPHQGQRRGGEANAGVLNLAPTLALALALTLILTLTRNCSPRPDPVKAILRGRKPRRDANTANAMRIRGAQRILVPVLMTVLLHVLTIDLLYVLTIDLLPVLLASWSH